MAEKVDIIDIDVTTLKDLREEVKRLRKELDNCAIGSEEFNKTLEELTQTQDALKNATKTNSKEIEAAEGSYDALVKKMSELKKAWRATADEMEKSKLGEEIADINTQLKEMDASLGNYQRNVGNYGSAFEGVTMKIDGTTASFERNIETTRGALDSFDLLEGGLRAIGVESEFVESVMSKVDGAMKFTNGLKAVKETAAGMKILSFSTKAAAVETEGLAAAQGANVVATKAATIATNGFKKALIATGIGAIVVALGTLIAYWDDFVALFKDGGDEAEIAAKKVEKLSSTLDGMDKDLELSVRIDEANGATEREIFKKREDGIRQQLELVQSAMDEETDQTSEHYKTLVEMQNELYDELKKNTDDWTVSDIKKKRESQEQQLKDAEEFNRRRKEQIIELENFKEQIYQGGLNDEDRELRQRELTYQSDAKRLKEWLNKKYLSQEEYNALSAQLDAQYNKDRVDIRKKYDGPLLESIDLEIEKKKEVIDIDAYIKQKQEENALSAQHEIENLTKKIETLDHLTFATDAVGIAMQELSSLDVDGLSSQWSEAFFRVGDTLQSVREGLVRLKTETLESGDKWNIYGDMAVAGLGAASSMMNALADQQDETSKDGFEKQKKLQIASATISMLQGMAGAFSQSMAAFAFPLGPIIGSAMSALVAATGIAQINQIKKQTFNGGGSGAVASTPSASPSVTAVQAMGGPAVNPVTNIEGASTEGTIQESRVWVSETDITDTQNKVKTVETESTY
jgi:hypothetical protein